MDTSEHLPLGFCLKVLREDNGKSGYRIFQRKYLSFDFKLTLLDLNSRGLNWHLFGSGRISEKELTIDLSNILLY